MVNWVMITVLVAVWNSRLNKLGDKPLTNVLDFSRRRLIGRIKIGYRSFFLTTMLQILKQSGLMDHFFK